MKLFVVPSWYPSRLNPKSGIFFHEHIRILQDAGDNIVVIASLTHSFKKIFMPNKLLKIQRGIFTEFGQTITYRHEALNWFPKRPQKTYRYQQQQLIRLFKMAIADQGSPDLVIAHSSLFAGAALSRWLQARSIPVIIFEHLMHFLKPDLLTGFYKDCIREAYHYADRIVAISSPLRTAIVNLFPEAASKIATIPNPVDISAFNIAPWQKADGAFEFLSVALFRPEKRHDILLRAFAQVRQRHPEVRLTMVGDGPEFRRIKCLIAELNLTDAVVLTGYLPQAEIATCMQKSQALVLASEFETFGVVLIEALASGLPVIATRCGGPEDIVTPESGFLIPVNDVEALAGTMQQMITENHRFNPQNIRQMAVEKYSSQRYRQAIHDLYNEIMNSKNT